MHTYCLIRFQRKGIKLFFPERIKSIKKRDKVLEVGPGNTPFYRSDTLLEKIFDSEDEAFEQSGRTESRSLKKEIIYYKDDTFPFANKKFDYVICSHVLEHIPKNDLPFFVLELARVAKMGYVEIPLYNFELITALDVHLSLIFVDTNNMLHFIFKEDINLEEYAYVRLRKLYEKLGFSRQVIPLNLNIFGSGFEFKEKVDFTIHDNVESFFNIVENETLFYKLKWHKGFSYFLKKIMYQFSKNIFKQKLYNEFRIVIK